MPDEQPQGESTRAPIQSSKGQVIYARFFTTRNLSVIVSGTVAIVALCKADSKDIPKIVETLAGSNSVATTGWAVAAVILAGAIVMVKVLLKIHDREIERIAKERDQLQGRLLKMLPPSEQ